MLSDLIDELIMAAKSRDKKRVERAYRNLEKVGVDRMTARIMANEVIKEKWNEKDC